MLPQKVSTVVPAMHGFTESRDHELPRDVHVTLFEIAIDCLRGTAGRFSNLA